jgi:hypothetical protein
MQRGCQPIATGCNAAASRLQRARAYNRSGTHPRKESAVTTLRTFISVLVHGQPNDEAHVHFHRGPQGSPAVCHDPGCEMARLEL